jgi:hypothetical protein
VSRISGVGARLVERVFETLRRNAGWAVGVCVLLAWFAFLYFMVADVL